MQEDEYLARLKIHRRHSSEIIGKYREARRLQRNKLDDQVELIQLMNDPNVDQNELRRHRTVRGSKSPRYDNSPLGNLLRNNETLYGRPKERAPRKSRKEVWFGDVGQSADGPKKRSKGLKGFLERLQ